MLPLLFLLTALTASDEPGIQDNSLLAEEAYNQDTNVVQHISFFQRDTRTHAWIYTFTQEWPAPHITHQLSYTLPLMTGKHIGDVALNYRYQLAGSGDSKFAMTPRFTLILPTGDWRRGEGNGAVGYNLAIATSFAPSERWNFHFDAGETTVPHTRGVAHVLVLADNIVWLPHKRLNAMVETLYQRADRTTSIVINPAVRWAYNFSSGLQIVPAIGFPFGVGPSARERSVILYVSFEHPFR